MQYVQVIDVENSKPIGFPSEDDGTLTVSSLAAHYPGATGLKYSVNGRTHAVKLTNGVLYPPENGWNERTYYLTFPKDNTKRKADDALETSESKTFKVDTDLMVLGLLGKTTDEKLRDYFSKFGELQLAQVKIDPISKKSKGYGFIRFANQEGQVRAMLQRHQIDGQWCDVNIPVSKEKKEIEALVSSIRNPETLVNVLVSKFHALRNNHRQALEDLSKERMLRQQAEDDNLVNKARVDRLKKNRHTILIKCKDVKYSGESI